MKSAGVNRSALADRRTLLIGLISKASTFAIRRSSSPKKAADDRCPLLFGFRRRLS